MPPFRTMKSAETSYLDIAADYHQRYNEKLERIFVATDTAWEVPYFIFKREQEPDETEHVGSSLRQ